MHASRGGVDCAYTLQRLCRCGTLLGVLIASLVHGRRGKLFERYTLDIGASDVSRVVEYNVYR